MSRLAQIAGESALRLLLRTVELGGVDESWQQTCDELGMSRSSYFSARSQLQALGFIDREGNLLWRTHRDEINPTTPPLVRSAPVVDFDKRPDYPALLASGEIKPRTLAMQVDNLPWSGDLHELMVARSPAQHRKREQTYALQAIGKVVLGVEIPERYLKQALTACDESAEDVYEIINEMQGRVEAGTLKLTAPGSYLAKVAEGQRARRMQAQPVRGLQAGTVIVDEAADLGPTPSDEFRDPVYEAKLAKLRKMGLIKKEEE
jgi:hypothetical protein